ncbi:MAG: transglutaminase family protein [Defluviitaleaceae bacterium]|nr:transglutaminase family protein [Defluviitaleaceae bacterium]
MKFILESNNLADYLKSDKYIDFHEKSVQKKADELFDSLSCKKEKIKAGFEYVRDKIHHSGDINSDKMTKSASEVLEHGEGICLAKSHLLAALLRYAGIPAGLCYQRLTCGDTPDTGYVTHGLNAVFLSDENKWIRLDARGNKQNVNSHFSIHEEKLAFPIRAEYGEVDYPVIHFQTHKKITEVMDKYKNYREYMAGITEL